MAKGISGTYTPNHPDKYMGDLSKITWRSTWELRFMKFCDQNPNIKKWSSEEIRVPYIKPTTKKRHTYWPDFYIEYVNAKGQLIKELIEIKPHKESTRTKKMSTYDKLALVVNEAKWAAARQFCKKHGIIFRVITEKTMFNTNK